MNNTTKTTGYVQLDSGTEQSMETDSIVTNKLHPQTTNKSSKENSVSITDMMQRQEQANTTKAKNSTVGTLPMIPDKNNTPVAVRQKFEEIPITDMIPLPKDKEVLSIEEAINELSSVRESEATNLIGQDAKTEKTVKLPQLSDTILTAG